MVEPRFSHIDTWHRLDLQSTKPSSKRRSISKRSWASIQFWKNADFLASFFLAVFFGCWFFWKIAGEIGETWALYEKGSVYILHLYVNSQYCSCFWHFVPSFWGSEMVFSGWKLFWLRATFAGFKTSLWKASKQKVSSSDCSWHYHYQHFVSKSSGWPIDQWKSNENKSQV